MLDDFDRGWLDIELLTDRFTDFFERTTAWALPIFKA